MRLGPGQAERLLDAGRALVVELDLEVVLERLLETARELTGARYAAIGVLDKERRGLERFLTSGIDPATHAAIGDLPRGRGILGLLIEEPHPIVLSDVGAHPRSYGFPAGHPPMSTFLGLPLLIRGRAWGNLYLTEKEGGEFDDADLHAVGVLADWAAIAIDHAHLFRESAERSVELERAVEGLQATTAIALALGSETDLDRVLELIVKRGRALVRARTVVLLLLEGDRLVAAAGAGQLDADTLGSSLPEVDSVAGEVLRSGRPERIADVSVRLGAAGRAARDPRRRDRSAGPAALPRARARRAVRVRPARRGAGVRRPRGGAAAVVRRERGDRRRDRQVGRGGAAAPQPALGRAGAQPLGARAARRDAAGAGRAGRAARVGVARRRRRAGAGRGQATEQLSTEIANLRALITELRPAALDQLGLVAALEGLGRRSGDVEGLEVELDVRVREGSLDPELKTAVYRLVQEALTNVAKHAGAARVAVTVEQRPDLLRVRVADDGRGFDAAEPTPGFGLAGMRERAELMGGRLEIDTSGAGTVVSGRLPALSVSRRAARGRARSARARRACCGASSAGCARDGTRPCAR